MRLRAVHLASLLLLLASIGVAEGSILRDGDVRFAGQYIGVLLGQDHANASTTLQHTPSQSNTLALDLPAASLAQHRTPWNLRPASAHSLALQAATAFAI